MPAQQQQPDTLCRICASRPATTTEWFLLRVVPLRDTCTSLDLLLALIDEAMRQPRPPSYADALCFATLTMITTMVPPPPRPGRESEPYTWDDLVPGRAELDLHDAGWAAGCEWARRSATPQELTRLARLDDPTGWRPGRLDTFGRDRAPGTDGGEAFHAYVRPDEAGRPGAADAFWQSVLGEADRGKEASGHFTYAFAEAAQSVGLTRPDVPRPRARRRGRPRKVGPDVGSPSP